MRVISPLPRSFISKIHIHLCFFFLLSSNSFVERTRRITYENRILVFSFRFLAMTLCRPSSCLGEYTRIEYRPTHALNCHWFIYIQRGRNVWRNSNSLLFLSERTGILKKFQNDSCTRSRRTRWIRIGLGIQLRRKRASVSRTKRRWTIEKDAISWDRECCTKRRVVFGTRSKEREGSEK